MRDGGDHPGLGLTCPRMPKPLEGTWYAHFNQKEASTFVPSTCHTVSLKWHNGTTLFAKYGFLSNTGQKEIYDLLGLLVIEPRVSFNVLKKGANGEYADFCVVSSLPFSKSTKTIKMTSNCFYEVVCGSKNKIPTPEELKEMEEVCPGATRTDNTKC